MSELKDEGDKAQDRKDNSMVLEAMMEELGIGRKDALYLDDKGPRIPEAGIGMATARPIDSFDPIASHWNNAEFDDIDEADKLLDPIADGQLYRQRQAVLNAQSKPQFAGHAFNGPNTQRGGSGSRSNKSRRGGHAGVGRGGYSHVGERGGYKGSSRTVSGTSTPKPRASPNNAQSRAEKNALIGNTIARLRRQPIQTHEQPPQRSRTREPRESTFTLATPEQFFAQYAKQSPAQEAPNPSSSLANANQPQVIAPNPDATGRTSSGQISQSSTGSHLKANEANSPAVIFPKGGLAASRWAPSSHTVTPAGKASNFGSPVKEPNKPTVSLPKEGLAASKWAPSNLAASPAGKISSFKPPAKDGPNNPPVTLPRGGLAASRWAPSSFSATSTSESLNPKPPVAGPSKAAIALPKEGLAASKWALPNQNVDLSSNVSDSKSSTEHSNQSGVRANSRPTISLPKDESTGSVCAPHNQAKAPASKTLPPEFPTNGHAQFEVNGTEIYTPVAKPTVELQGSNQVTSSKSITVPSISPSEFGGAREPGATKMEKCKQEELGTSNLVTSGAREHINVELQRNSGPIRKGAIRLSRVNNQSPLALDIYVGPSRVFSATVPTDSVFILDGKSLNLCLKEKNGVETFWKFIFPLAHTATSTYNQVLNDSFRLSSARNETAKHIMMPKATTPTQPMLAENSVGMTPELIQTSSQSPNKSQTGNEPEPPRYYAGRISSGTLSDLSVLEGGKKLIVFGDSEDDEQCQEPKQYKVSSLSDLVDLNDQYTIEGAFEMIDAHFGSFLVHLCDNVGQQSLNVDSPEKELLASDSHIEACEQIVDGFFKFSDKFTQLSRLDLAAYVKDFSYKVFARALAFRSDSASSIPESTDSNVTAIHNGSQRTNINQALESSLETPHESAKETQPSSVGEGTTLPSSTATNSTTVAHPTARYVYPIDDLVKMRGQAIAVKGELLPKRELDPRTYRSIIRYTVPGQAIVADREKDQDGVRFQPKFKSSSSASDWQAFADSKITVRSSATAHSKPESRNSPGKLPTLFSYENSASAFESNDHSVVEEANLASSNPPSVFKPAATIEDKQTIANIERSTEAESPAQELPLGSSLPTPLEKALENKPDKPKTPTEFGALKPLQSSTIPKAPSKNVESSRDLSATSTSNKDSGNVSTSSLAGVSSGGLCLGVPDPIGRHSQKPLPETPKQPKAPSVSSAKSSRPLNAIAAEYKSPLPSRPVISKQQTETPNFKDAPGLSASMWATPSPKAKSTPALRPSQQMPLATMETMSQDTNLAPPSPFTLTPFSAHGAAIQSPNLAGGNATQLENVAPGPTMQPGRTWRIYDSNSGNMIDIVGQIVGVTSVDSAAPPSPILNMAATPFNGQENVPISARAAMMTDPTKPKPKATDSHNPKFR